MISSNGGETVMENIYRTAQVAKIIGIHPNSVRLYEELGLISKPQRLSNGIVLLQIFILNNLNWQGQHLKLKYYKVI